MTDNAQVPTRGLAAKLLPAPFYALRGAGFIWSHRVLWKYAAAPLAIGTVVLGIAYAVIYYFLFGLISPFGEGKWYWQVLYYVSLAIVTVLLLVIVFFLFTRVASAIASPFNDLISQKTEELVIGSFDDTLFTFWGLLKDSGRAIVHSFKILGIYVGLLVASLPVLFIPGIGSLIFAVWGAALSSYMFAYEYLGYPMDRRRYSFTEKRQFLWKHFRASMGFGLGNLAVAPIPVVNLLLIPAAVVGGTLLFLEVESPKQSSDPASRNAQET
jgi:CysZ protein